MPKRNSKKESTTLDGTKTNGINTHGLTGNGVAVAQEGGSPRSSQKAGKSGTGLKHLFGWNPLRKKSTGNDKVPRSVSSSALSETRTVGFKRTASNGEVEPGPSRASVDYLMPPVPGEIQRQRHSSDRVLKTEKAASQIYSVPSDTRVNGAGYGAVKSPSPVNVQSTKPPQQDYTEPWSSTAAEKDGLKLHTMSNVHSTGIKSGGTSFKKKENVYSASDHDTSVSPQSVSPEIVNGSDDYEEPWDKYTGGMPPFRRKSKDKLPPGRISPMLPPKPVAELPPKPVVEITKPLPPLPPLPDDEEKPNAVPNVLPTRGVSLKTTFAISDYSLPCDTKRMSDTIVPTFRPLEKCPSAGGSSTEDLRSPSPPPLPVRYTTVPVVNANIPLEEQPWYHHELSRGEAEAMLKDTADFSFLVRNSESSSDPYSLSIRNTGSGFMHLKIAYKNDTYVIGQFSKPFYTVPEAIDYYTRNKLTLRGAEHKQLRFPVHTVHQ